VSKINWLFLTRLFTSIYFPLLSRTQWGGIAFISPLVSLQVAKKELPMKSVDLIFFSGFFFFLAAQKMIEPYPTLEPLPDKGARLQVEYTSFCLRTSP